MRRTCFVVESFSGNGNYCRERSVLPAYSPNEDFLENFSVLGAGLWDRVLNTGTKIITHGY